MAPNWTDVGTYQRGLNEQRGVRRAEGKCVLLVAEGRRRKNYQDSPHGGRIDGVTSTDLVDDRAANDVKPG